MNRTGSSADDDDHDDDNNERNGGSGGGHKKPSVSSSSSPPSSNNNRGSAWARNGPRGLIPDGDSTIPGTRRGARSTQPSRSHSSSPASSASPPSLQRRRGSPPETTAGPSAGSPPSQRQQLQPPPAVVPTATTTKAVTPDRPSPKTPPNGRKRNGNNNSGRTSTIPNYNTIGHHGNDKDTPVTTTKTDLLARPPSTTSGGCGSSACQCGDHCLCHVRSEVCECAASQIVSSCCDPRNNTGHNNDTIRLMIDGMTCTQCVAAIANALRGPIPTATVSLGVVELPLLLSNGDSNDNDDDGVALVEQATDIIESIGYEVVQVVRPTANNPRAVWDGMHEQHERELQKSRRLFLASLFLTLPIAAWEWILSRLVVHDDDDVPVVYRRGNFVLSLDTLVLVICATLVQFVCGYDFYKKTYYGSTGMHVLVAIATTTAYCYAIYNVVRPGNNGSDMAAFDTATVLITFVLCGQYLQASAMQRTRHGLERLMELQSRTAVRVVMMNNDEKMNNTNPLHDPYREEFVPIEQVVVGDLLKVIRGASIPTDGVIEYGTMEVDESMVTGESLPVLKTEGSVLLGGTVCRDGVAFFRVTAVGADTALSHIMRIVQEAQTSAVPIQTMVDRVAEIFVPIVCTFSLITYLVWYALCSAGVVPRAWYQEEGSMAFSLMFAIACLVISCPCALGLATPTAVMVGTGMGAKNGILIKGGAALEVASKVDAIVFDKTGTLTKGQPEVSDFIHLDAPVKKGSRRETKNATMADDEDRQAKQDYLLWQLGSLERNSEHPLGKAIVKYAQGQLGEAIMESNPFAEPTNFKAVTGRGAMGELLGKVTVAIGNRSFIKMLDLTVSATTESSMKELELQGKTAMMAVVDDVVVAVIGVADELKPDARAAITYLQSNLNAEVWMVTGDNAVTANSIRAQIGLAEDRVIAEALPATKLEKVKELQAAGKIVAMVGDGINDSPALAQADVGIGIGTGAEIAAEASDIVLVSGKSVFEVCVAFHMARAIYQRIIWNLVWSLAYNCIAIPVAAGALYPLTKTRLPPAVAAALMALSSISVVMGSLSLYLYKPPVCDNLRINQGEEENSHTRQAEDGEVNDNGDIENGLTANLLSNDHLGRPCYGSKQSLHLMDKSTVQGSRGDDSGLSSN